MSLATAKIEMTGHLADLHAFLGSFQDAYLVANGRMWQGIQLAAVVPDHENRTVPVLRRPTDYPDTWTGLGYSLPATMPGTMAVDVYQASDGWGYVTRASLMDGSNLWEKTVATGPEMLSRVKDWSVTPRVEV